MSVDIAALPAPHKASMDPSGTNEESRVQPIVGSPGNFWLWSPGGWDLTHPPSPTSPPIEPRVHLECEIANVTVDPLKTALLIVDMQNISMNTALGVQVVPAVLQAEELLLRYAIPAARKANIQIIWLNWGLTDKDLETIPPGVMRVFAWRSNCEAHDYSIFSHSCSSCEAMGTQHRGERPKFTGPGTELGQVLLPDNTKVNAGRAMMRGSWNTELHDPLLAAFLQGRSAMRPDVIIHKNRNSGLYDSSCDLALFLKDKGIRTLLFAGMNTDQCVMSTLQDAHSRGFDTIMLRDACATNSPDFAQQSAEFNCCKNWGFLSSCSGLAKAAGISGTGK